MGASAITCPICASPAPAGGPADEELVTSTGGRDEQGAVDHRSVQDVDETAAEVDEDLDVVIDLTDADEPASAAGSDVDRTVAGELVSSSTYQGGADRQAAPADARHTMRGRTRPKRPLRPYVPPEQVERPAAAETEAPDDEERIAGGSPASSGGDATSDVAPPPPPPVTDTFLSVHPDGLDGQPPSSPWAPPEAAATPAPTADTPSEPGTSSESEPESADGDEARPADPRRRTARVLLVLLVVMVGVGLWLQWDRIGDLFDGDEESSPAEVTEVGPGLDETGTAQAPVVEGRLERNVGSFVTQVTLESITT
jgi:hypothetical protein